MYIYHTFYCAVQSYGASGFIKSFLPLGRLLGLPIWPAGPARASALPSWASVLPVLACRTPIGRQLDAKWAPSWSAKTAASVNIRLKDAKTAAKSHRTPCQQYVCRRMATYATLVYIYIYIYICDMI